MVCVRLTWSEVAAVDRFAEREGIDRSAMIRALLAEAIQQREVKERRMTSTDVETLRAEIATLQAELAEAQRWAGLVSGLSTEWGIRFDPTGTTTRATDGPAALRAVDRDDFTAMKRFVSPWVEAGFRPEPEAR